jgi:hypothetical protein
VELIGRTDEGEAVEEMVMARGGTVDWTDEAKVREGLCAYPGGEQSVRVIPEALEFIRVRAEALPDED